MENHPIPQDVTGFQFKLIGNMTLKQFGYVGVGVVLAVIFYYAPIAWYFKFVLIPTLTVLGVSLAFVPIDGRPLDQMIWYFCSAILKPDRFIYQKQGGVLSFTELNLHPITQVIPTTQVQKYSPEEHKKAKQLMNYLYDSNNQVVNPLDKLEDTRLSSLFSQNTMVQPTPVISNTPISPIKMMDAPIQHPVQPTPVIRQAIPETNKPPVMAAPVQSSNIPQDESLSEILKVSTPIQEATSSTNQPQNVNTKPVVPSTFVQVVEPTQEQQQPAVKNLSGMDFPNLITGIVKDSRGNVLAGILVEVKNKEGESVRAFKTNALGQFASATQLPNGTFTITFEDPKGQHKFENVEIEANGVVLEPLIVISLDAREELRRSLFG